MTSKELLLKVAVVGNLLMGYTVNAQSVGISSGVLTSRVERATAQSDQCSISLVSKLDVKPGYGFTCCHAKFGQKVHLASFVLLSHEKQWHGEGQIGFELFAQGDRVASIQKFTGLAPFDTVAIVKTNGQQFNCVIAGASKCRIVENLPVFFVDLNASEKEREINVIDVDELGIDLNIIDEKTMDDFFLCLYRKILESNLSFLKTQKTDKHTNASYLDELRDEFRKNDLFRDR